jgi:hypothetical protein
MSAELVLRALSQLTLFSAICLVGTGTIVAGVHAANLRAIPLCSHDGCSVVYNHEADGLTSPAHIQGVATVLWKKKA